MAGGLRQFLEQNFYAAGMGQGASADEYAQSTQLAALMMCQKNIAWTAGADSPVPLLQTLKGGTARTSKRRFSGDDSFGSFRKLAGRRVVLV